jgi:hypothetical protein
MKTRAFWMMVLGGYCMSGAVIAQTNVSGPISVNTTWLSANGPYIVEGNTLVQEGITLTIEPDVTVEFETGMALQVDGELVAIGTVDMPVVFTSAALLPEPGDWGYISFSNASADAEFDTEGNYVSGSVMEYCVVEYAGGNTYNFGAIIIDNALPYIFRCVIRDNSASGIYGINLTGPLRIVENLIADNTAPTGGGISVWGGYVIIEGNTISGNNAESSYGGGGIFAISNTTEITNNLIEGNSSIGYGAGGGGGGIYIREGISTIAKNIIRNNTLHGYFSAGEGGGILSYLSTVDILQNEITNNLGAFGGGVFGGNLIAKNCISENFAEQNGGGIYMPQSSVINNSLVYNGAEMGSVIDFYLAESPSEFRNNLLRGNVVTGEEPSFSIGISAHPLIRFNNILDNTSTYELYNRNGTLTPHVDATENWWGTVSEAEIQGVIYDWVDDATYGIVDFYPFAAGILADAPVAPPSGLTMEQGTGEISLVWNANTEPDLAGYKVHWGTSKDYPFENTIDAGNTTFYTITGLTGGDYYVSVTAYDTYADTVTDDPSTMVNEIQCAGNESWYAKAISTLGINEPVIGGQAIMAIYPNPTTGYITVNVPTDASEIHVLNSLGQVVYKIRAYDQTTYNFLLKKKGTYFVNVVAANQTFTEKVIVY